MGWKDRRHFKRHDGPTFVRSDGLKLTSSGAIYRVDALIGLLSETLVQAGHTRNGEGLSTPEILNVINDAFPYEDVPMDPICKADGCYMFAADTPEQTECVKKCRLIHKPRVLTGRMTSTVKFNNQRIRRTDADQD